MFTESFVDNGPQLLRDYRSMARNKYSAEEYTTEMLLRLFFTLVPCVLCLTTSALAAISVEDVVKMAKAGLGEDVIIAQLAKENAKFDLSVDDLIKLKGAKVPEQVIKAMVSGPASPGASTTASSTAAGSRTSGTPRRACSRTNTTGIGIRRLSARTLIVS